MPSSSAPTVYTSKSNSSRFPFPVSFNSYVGKIFKSRTVSKDTNRHKDFLTKTAYLLHALLVFSGLHVFDELSGRPELLLTHGAAGTRRTATELQQIISVQKKHFISEFFFSAHDILNSKLLFYMNTSRLRGSPCAPWSYDGP